MKRTSKKYSPEVRERAVRLVRDHRGEYATEWEAICSIAQKIGCAGETLRLWIRQDETGRDVRNGMSTADRDRLKALERENRELRQANDILRAASAFFAAAELDRRFKK
ncbi:transposase [Ensifer sp. SEMIA 135]|nr:transposase [Ensifer sp. SEMIA 134]TWB21027.1 transposase [Ensifer sp. SEMIA 135]